MSQRRVEPLTCSKICCFDQDTFVVRPEQKYRCRADRVEHNEGTFQVAATIAGDKRQRNPHRHQNYNRNYANCKHQQQKARASRSIPYEVSTQAKAPNVPGVLPPQVTSSSPSSAAEQYQRTWTVTFVSPVGDFPEIELGSDEGLTSYGNEFTFATIQDGTSAGG